MSRSKHAERFYQDDQIHLKAVKYGSFGQDLKVLKYSASMQNRITMKFFVN